MTDTIKAALITGILGFITTITAAIIGINFGKMSEQKSINNEIQESVADVINVIGDNNEVTINSVKDLVDEYLKLKSQNDSLLGQSLDNYNKWKNAENRILELESLIDNIPNLSYSNLGLSIDAQNIPIDKNNSMITINDKNYFSEEIVKSLILDEQSFSIKDDTLFIGKVISEKSNLSETNLYQEENSELKKEIENLQNEIEKYQNKVTSLQDEISNLQSELNEYVTIYGKVSVDNSEVTSIFTLETFQGREYWKDSSVISNSKSFSSNNFIDTYGNEYPEANLAEHYHLNKKDKYAPTYLLDYNYSKCEGKIAWPKSDKNEEGYVWIEFYSDDKLFYQTEPMYASDRALEFEFSVEGVEKLTVVKKGSTDAGIIYIIYPYFNFIK